MCKRRIKDLLRYYTNINDLKVNTGFQRCYCLFSLSFSYVASVLSSATCAFRILGQMYNNWGIFIFLSLNTTTPNAFLFNTVFSAANRCRLYLNMLCLSSHFIELRRLWSHGSTKRSRSRDLHTKPNSKRHVWSFPKYLFLKDFLNKFMHALTSLMQWRQTIKRLNFI